MELCLRRFANLPLALALAAYVLPTPDAVAGKEHCRTLELGGAAGPASADKVELQVTDYLGNIVDRSCKVTVQANECADDLAKRLVATWGSGSQGGQQQGCGVDQDLTTTCGRNLDITPVDPGDTNASKIFCKHRYKAGKVVGGTNATPPCPNAPPNGQEAGPGELKKLPKIEVCCYEQLDATKLAEVTWTDPGTCKGSKLGKALIAPQRIEVSVFDRIDRPNVAGDGIFFDPKLADNSLDVPVGYSSRQVALDPIGFEQRPSATGTSCRGDVAEAANNLGKALRKSLVECNLAQIAGKIPPTDCGMSLEVQQIIASYEALLRAAPVADCEGRDVATAGPRISPAVYGLRSCPAPCDGISIGTCSAGQIGNVCSSDRGCDTAPGAADGKCGSWDDASECIACLQENAATLAAMTVFGVPPPLPPLPELTLKCLFELGEGAFYLARVYTNQLVDCQARIDTAKSALPNGVPFCKKADLKGRRADAESQVRARLVKACTDADLLGLLVCNGNTTVSQLGDCAKIVAEAMAEQLSNGVFPESRTICGNDLLERGEQCDGADDAACDGLCQPDCTCPDPVCGNNVTEGTEQCDGTSDVVCPGQCLPGCTCP